MIEDFNELIKYIVSEEKSEYFRTIVMNFSSGNITHAHIHHEFNVDCSNDLIIVLSGLKKDKYKGKVYYKKENSGKNVLITDKAIDVNIK